MSTRGYYTSSRPLTVARKVSLEKSVLQHNITVLLVAQTIPSRISKYSQNTSIREEGRTTTITARLAHLKLAKANAKKAVVQLIWWWKVTTTTGEFGALRVKRNNNKLLSSSLSALLLLTDMLKLVEVSISHQITSCCCRERAVCKPSYLCRFHF